MSLQDSLFSEDVEDDVTTFARNKTRRRALVFPPVNNYRRFIIHQLVQERFSELLHTFSIGQAADRRTVVCFKSDLRSDWEPKTSIPESRASLTTKQVETTRRMGVEGRRSSSASPDHAQVQRQAKSMPAVEIYRPPAARRAATNCSQASGTQVQAQPTADSPSVKNTRQRRPDRAVYIPRHRRSLEAEEKRPRNLRSSCTSFTEQKLSRDPNTNNNSKAQETYCVQQSVDESNAENKFPAGHSMKVEEDRLSQEASENVIPVDSDEMLDTHDCTEHAPKLSSDLPQEDAPILAEKIEAEATSTFNDSIDLGLLESSDKVEVDDQELETTRSSTTKHLNSNDPTSDENERLLEQNEMSNVLVISDTAEDKSKHTEQQQAPAIMTLPEKKVKKIERPKSKPAPPPSPPLKINRDECDWDSLFDDNGDCLDPSLIEELTAAVGEVMVEQPKNDYKAYSKQVQVSSDEFAHVVEIYNFPSEFKTSDLAAVFSPFRNSGFELKWVDDTHCLGIFSSPLIAAEVLASNHPFVKTRPLSEASALSKTKARKSAEFLQPYRNRPETCAALARRLVTGALGVKLATARQEREHEKNVLREAKEKRRLANKQREDVWEGIIPGK